MRPGGGEGTSSKPMGLEARDTMEPCALSPSDSSNCAVQQQDRPTVHFMVSNRYSRLDNFGFALSLWNDGSQGELDRSNAAGGNAFVRAQGLFSRTVP